MPVAFRILHKTRMSGHTCERVLKSILWKAGLISIVGFPFASHFSFLQVADQGASEAVCWPSLLPRKGSSQVGIQAGCGAGRTPQEAWQGAPGCGHEM